MVKDTRSMKSIRKICQNCGKNGQVNYNIFYRKDLCLDCNKVLDIKLKQEHPEYFLKYCGVPKKLLTSSLDNFENHPELVQRFKNYVKTWPLESIIIVGVCGNGKSHLAVAILRELVKMNVKINDFEFISVIELLQEIKASYDKNSNESEAVIIQRYTSKKLVVLDDFGYDEKPTNWQINLLFLIIDRMIRDSKVLIITTNYDLEVIDDKFGTRIADRLAEIRIIRNTMSSYRKRRFKKVG